MTNDQKIALKPVTDALKKEYLENLPPSTQITTKEGKVEPDFMFFVVANYEGVLKKLRDILPKEIKASVK